jgi:hypothetical protein
LIAAAILAALPQAASANRLISLSTSAKAMIQRRDNLKRSVDELKRQIGDAKVGLE